MADRDQTRPDLSEIAARWKSHTRIIREPSGGLNASGEKARRIALKLNKLARSNAKDAPSAGGGGLSGLWRKIKAQRANKDPSLENDGGGGEDTGESAAGRRMTIAAMGRGSDVDRWFKVAEHVRGLGNAAKEAGEDDGAAEPGSEGAEETGAADEQTPLVQPSSLDGPPSRNSRFRSLFQPSPGSLLHDMITWWTELRKQMKMLAIAFNAPFVKERLVSFLKNGVLMFIVPALAVSAFFYYQLNNPSLYILPRNASISYWILFGIRHYLTLQVSGRGRYCFWCLEVATSLQTVCIRSSSWPLLCSTFSLVSAL